MQTIKEAAPKFLASRRVAVTGVSQHPKDHGSNVVYRRFRERGCQVFAVNPNANEVEGDVCYHDLRSIPGSVEAVVIGTRSEVADETSAREPPPSPPASRPGWWNWLSLPADARRTTVLSTRDFHLTSVTCVSCRP